MFTITVTGEHYGSYGPFKHVDACDATFSSPSEADSSANGYTCGSRYGLQQGVLRSSTGKTVGILSCANQDFDIAVTAKTYGQDCVIASASNACPQVSLKSLGRLDAEQAALEENFTGTFEDCVRHLETLYTEGAGFVRYYEGGKCQSWVIRGCQNGEAAPSSCPDPDVAPCSVGSEYTESMLDKMDTAQRDFEKCNADIFEIAGTLTTFRRISLVVHKSTEAMDLIMEKIDAVMDKIIKPPPVGMGIGDILGKIPKIGIFVKMGMKAAGKVVDGLEPLADLIAKWGKRIDDAVYVVDKTFLAAKVVSAPTALYLSGSHRILEAAHQCASATGYRCGTKAAELEARNEADYASAAESLDEIALAGRTCHDVLSPVDALMREMAEIAEKIAELLQPILDALEAVEDFISDMEREIQKFVDALADSAGVQCVLEIFEPVTDTVNLLTCPIDEAAGALMHFVIDRMTSQVGTLLAQATNKGITAAVDAIVPDGLDLYIPDFTAIIPADFYFDFCSDAALAFPGLPQTIADFTSLPLPKHITGKDIEESILSEALLDAGELTVDIGDYDSACVAAWNEMGTDFENCQKVLDEIEAAAKVAACETAKTAHEANEVLVDGALITFNAANDHFQSAQSDFVAATNHLNKVQRDLDNAKQAVEDEKSNCPSCRCGGCSWHDVGCIVESAWCCPAKHTCLLALDIAKGSVDVAKGTVDVAEGAVHATQATYNAASTALTHASNDLNYYKNLASQSQDAVDSACNRRRSELQRLLIAQHGLEAPLDA